MLTAFARDQSITEIESGMVLGAVGNANKSNLSRETRLDQVSLYYRPSVGRVSAKRRWLNNRESTGMHVDREATEIDQRIGRREIRVD